jgi:PAP2 superfamily.
MATLVGISRLTERAHWASDVFVGGLIGYVCGKQVVANLIKHIRTYLLTCHQNQKSKQNSFLFKMEIELDSY